MFEDQFRRGVFDSLILASLAGYGYGYWVATPGTWSTVLGFVTLAIFGLAAIWRAPGPVWDPEDQQNGVQG